jgi:hypothetical protein
VNDLLIAAQIDAYQFEGEKLTTGAYPDSQVRLLNNQIYDPSTVEPSPSDPPSYQSFLITQPEAAAVQIGWASKKQGKGAIRRIILRITHGLGPDLSIAEIEMDERGTLLTGLGPLSGPTAAIWTVSFLDPIPRAGAIG